MTSESALEGGNGVTDEDVSVSGSAVDDEDLPDLLSLMDVSLPVPDDAPLAGMDSTREALEEGTGAGVLWRM